MPNVKPIPFTLPMARAIDAGRKTMTRRVLKTAPRHAIRAVIKCGWIMWETGNPLEGYRRFGDTPVPYLPGDFLWVREPWRTEARFDALPPRDIPRSALVSFEADHPDDPNDGCRGRFRPGMFLPRWASRLTLEVTAVKVERLQEISDADALAEGVDCDESLPADVHRCWLDLGKDSGGAEWLTGWDARDVFHQLWHVINGPGAWEANPWVAAYSFRVHRVNVDDLLRSREAV